MVQQFSAGCSRVGDGLDISIVSVLLIHFLELKVDNLVCWLPVLCGGGTVATTVTRLGPLPGKLGYWTARVLLGPYRLKVEYSLLILFMTNMR